MIKTSYLSTCVPTHKVIQNKNKYIAHNNHHNVTFKLLSCIVKIYTLSVYFYYAYNYDSYERKLQIKNLYLNYNIH